MARDLRTPQAADVATPDMPRPKAGMPDAPAQRSPFAGWDVPAWATSPVAQITIATCRAIGTLAASVAQKGVDASALARLKNIHAGILEVLRRGFDDLDRAAVIQLYRLCTVTQRTLHEVPRQDQPAGWDARLIKVHSDFLLVAERLRALWKKSVAAPSGASEQRIDDIARRATDLADDIRALEPRERTELRLLVSETLMQAFAEPAGSSATVREAQAFAHALWAERDAFAGETALGFLQRVYGTRLNHMRLADLASIDQPLYQALQTWRRRNTPPAHLKSFFSRQRRSRAEIDAELKKHRIKKPEDAFARFPDDRATAQRLYQAARARQTR